MLFRSRERVIERERERGRRERERRERGEREMSRLEAWCRESEQAGSLEKRHFKSTPGLERDLGMSFSFRRREGVFPAGRVSFHLPLSLSPSFSVSPLFYSSHPLLSHPKRFVRPPLSSSLVLSALWPCGKACGRIMLHGDRKSVV